VNQISLRTNDPAQDELDEMSEYINEFVERVAELDSVVRIAWNESVVNPRVHVHYLEWITSPIHEIELDLSEEYDVWRHVDVQVYRSDKEEYETLYQLEDSANHQRESKSNE